MRNASGQQGENERRWKIKANMKVRNTLGDIFNSGVLFIFSY